MPVENVELVIRHCILYGTDNATTVKKILPNVGKSLLMEENVSRYQPEWNGIENVVYQ